MGREFLAGYLFLLLGGAVSIHSSDAVPNMAWFAKPSIGLRSFSPPNSPASKTLPPTLAVSEQKESFGLESAKASASFEGRLHAYQSMNGKPPLQIAPAPSANRFVRGLDLFLPPKSTFFSKNPNARRDLLVPDSW
ncbi:MAG TPA: hypothetical protein VGR78_17430 [Verrucomicrobiae bacterium]|nr:hypothetical protein [Verrucomicrobiae bacterium]